MAQVRTMPGTTALTLYGIVSGAGVSFGSLAVSPRLQGKEVPVNRVFVATLIVVLAGVIGVAMLTTPEE